MAQEKYIEVTLIKSDGEHNPVIEKVLHSVNTYLLKNKGAVSDFNLIKDVVDRNTDAVDEEINNLLPIPLYLGLVGTMVGIIIGLFLMGNMSAITTAVDGESTPNNLGNPIDMLIGGVKIAMIASFVGLLLTIILSGWLYKGAKTRAEGLKNDFFTWIQTNLLPVLSQNTSSSLYSLQANLVKFNDNFTANIQDFNHLMNNILTSFDSQVSLMNDLKEIDVARMAKLNVNVLKELRISMKEFTKFNAYLGQLNLFVDNAQKLNYNLSSQLDRTRSLERIAESIGSNIEVNKNMVDVLQSELKEIGERKQFVQDAVIDVDNSIEKMLSELKIHISAQVDAIKDITIKEEDLLEKLLKEDRGNLDELKKLGDLKKSMVAIQKEGKSQNEKLDRLVALLSADSDRKARGYSLLSVEGINLPKTIGFVFAGITVVIVFVYMLHMVLNYFFL